MRGMWKGVVVVCALGLSFAVAARDQLDLKAEVKALGDDLAQAMLAGDVDKMLSFYTEDAISLPNFAPRMDGVAAFRKQHEQMSATGMKILTFDSTPTEVWQCGNQVIEIGDFKISLEMPGAPQPVEDYGTYITIYERQSDGKLKIKVETWNTDIDPMSLMGAPAPSED